MDLVAFQNVIAATEPALSIWPEAVNHLENGFRFVEVLAAWTLAVLLAGGGHYIASLMWLWAMWCIAIHQVAVLLLVATTTIPRFRAVQLPNGRRLIVESGGLWVRFPFDMCLPYPDACHESEQGKTYVFYLARIVVKIIFSPESYSKEVSFYREWAGLQGSGIPWLLARGKCFGDNLPFLIISNEGTRLAKITKEDQDILEKTVIQTLHRSGWHHHDLAARNVVRSASRKLCLIDFGEAEHCERDGCQDLWQSE
ncbi:hypothetical protein NMY22_g19669 [Coprinellus aureogranulatus]|nr:hypothetical protein NMY22_g19669 [Coprinellus aureogranulatus]